MALPNVIVSPETFKLVNGVNEECILEVTNVSYDPVIYRLQTVAPQHYVVKHAKGVLLPNSVVKIIVTLNQHRMKEADKNIGAAKIIKDYFLLEYALLSENDVIEPRYANVSQLIKGKKTQNPSSVLRKILRSHIFLDASDAITTGPNPTSSADLQRSQPMKAVAIQPHDGASDLAIPAADIMNTKINDKTALSPQDIPKKKLDAVGASTVANQYTCLGLQANTLFIIAAFIVAVVIWIFME